MPRFSKHFSLSLTQHELDFVDVSNTFDTPVYVDPYAIEIQNDVWAATASELIRVFFKEVLNAIRSKDIPRAINLMSHLTEPQETFLGVSSGNPAGRGVGPGQSRQLIRAIATSKAYKTGLLADLSEMALYVEGIDRDKISDLTTNIIREQLVDYTQKQCELYDIPTQQYSGPSLWDAKRKNWISKYVQLPFIKSTPVLLVPKYIVRRKLSLDSQEFYNKQITDYLIAENLRASSSLVHVLKSGEPKVYKSDVRKKHPKSKSFIADVVKSHPELLALYKDIARKERSLSTFDDREDIPTLTTACARLAEQFAKVPTGAKHADAYHRLTMGALTALFYPDLILPQKEWEVNDGRKRIDIVFTNNASVGFFAQRRDDPKLNANLVIVECKNYSSDLANPEFDQLLGRFDDNRGRFGIITCRSIDDYKAVKNRCLDAASRSRGYIIVLTDADMVAMLTAKSQLQDKQIAEFLHRKYRELLT
ncbi:hypothetical protein ACQ86E_14805 [Bradyrhizobium betae]|uniref:hypothetical protein n=1 Tax=Bradyrhizobium betae TaxID=244734 RepID=UPI003D676AA2